MIKQVLSALMAAVALSATAGPIVFFDTRYEVTAIASTVDGEPAFESQSGLSADTALLAQAVSVGSTDVATAGAIAGIGLLSTSADSSSLGGDVSSAVSMAGFSGWFTSSGPVTLSFDFLRFDDAADSGLAESLLFVSLVNDGVTLFADFIDGATQLSFNPLAGTLSYLELMLSSTVSAGFPQGPGSAAGFGLVSFSANAVPLAASWTFALLGLAALAVPAATRRRPAA